MIVLGTDSHHYRYRSNQYTNSQRTSLLWYVMSFTLHYVSTTTSMHIAINTTPSTNDQFELGLIHALLAIFFFLSIYVV